MSGHRRGVRRALLDGRVTVEGWGIDATVVAPDDPFAPETLEMPGI